MIEAQAVVLRLDAGIAVVASDDNLVCSRCADNGGCGVAKLTRALCIKPREYRVANTVGAQPGDKVTVGVPEGAVLKSSLVVYLIPLMLLVFGAAIGSLAAPADASRDGYAIVGFVAALVVSAMWLMRVNQLRGVFLPVIVRRGSE